jgi:hypothetical protein
MHVHPPPPATRKKCKFVYLRLDNFLRAVDPNCFDADPELDPAQNLDADPDPDPDPDLGGGGVGQPKMCIPPGKILGTPLDDFIALTPTYAYFPYFPIVFTGKLMEDSRLATGARAEWR